GSQAVIDGDAGRPRLETSGRDFAASAAAILVDRPVPLPRLRYYRLVDNPQDSGNGPPAGKQHHLMAGVAPGDEARRAIVGGKEAGPEALKAYKARHNLETVAMNLKDPSTTLAQVGPLLGGLPEDQGAAAALAIANLYARQGQWLLARET